MELESLRLEFHVAKMPPSQQSISRLRGLGGVWQSSLRIIVWSFLEFFEIRVGEKVCGNVYNVV